MLLKTKRKLPSKAAIADYWKDKELPNGHPVIIDWYEPSCWACGRWTHNEKEGEMIEKGDFKGLWNHPIYNLERCHIIPSAIGGSDNVDNLFLMCHWCHKSSPDTSNPEYFFDWVMKRSWADTVKETPIWKASRIILDYGYKLADFTEFINKVSNHEIDFNVDIDTNTHGFELSESTMIYTYVDAFIKYTKKEDINGES